MSKTLQIYVVSLANKCYYLGVSYDCLHEFAQMIDGNGPEWTRIHKPLTIEKIIQASVKDLDVHVKYYMKKYGIQNVRGGSYTTPSLDSWEIQELEEELGLATPKRASSPCDAWHCGPCGRPFQTYEETKGHLMSCPKVKLDICPRCQQSF